MRHGSVRGVTRARLGWLLGPLLAASLVASDAHATAPSAFTVQGVLRDNTGALQSMAISVSVAFYTTQTGGSPFSPTLGPYAAMASNGVFSVEVSGPGLLAGIQAQSSVWLELTVAGIGTFPRQQVTSELYALEAASADALSCSGCVTSSNITSSGLPGSVINSPVANATNATGIDGAQISGALSAGQVLEYNGTNWVPTTVSSLGGGLVTSVTASTPLASSGGATPNISLTGVIPIANGGTGSPTENFVDLTTNQTVGGQKSFIAPMSVTSSLATSAALTLNMPSNPSTGIGLTEALAATGANAPNGLGGVAVYATGGVTGGANFAGSTAIEAVGASSTGAGDLGGSGIAAFAGSGPAGYGSAATLFGFTQIEMTPSNGPTGLQVTYSGTQTTSASGQSILSQGAFGSGASGVGSHGIVGQGGGSQSASPGMGVWALGGNSQSSVAGGTGVLAEGAPRRRG